MTLSSDEVKRLKSCVLGANDVFAAEKRGKSPVRQAPRQVPFSVHPEMVRMVNEMLSAHVIEESSSPWASPVVLVKKKQRTKVLCRLSSA